MWMRPASRKYRGWNYGHSGNWLSDMDSNHDKGLQRALCYHYTIGQYAGKIALFPACAKQIFRINPLAHWQFCQVKVFCPSNLDLDSSQSKVDICRMSSYWLVKQEPEA